MALTTLDQIIRDVLYDFDGNTSDRVVCAIRNLRPDFAAVLDGYAKIVTNSQYELINEQKGDGYATFSIF